tara:strand:- start:576 stop:764 length:189 start_codon:yes stop_codon:yes gene_type:complete
VIGFKEGGHSEASAEINCGSPSDRALSSQFFDVSFQIAEVTKNSLGVFAEKRCRVASRPGII